ncbi:tripartite tricarboxylate transporter TctB family protein [Modestobacter sp. VKM Ac-2977]|uniref:tripartite tricarboxylate transporter TctB family protein n=1 Tax=Modestobacter sp. VKM Ac-2977 TaxID=3004131 RepID=UPI0022AA5A5D|nr:tripartite tricarboxylate transporter TctB family protein [Modestobacter sp. VKM Ac-2977]MCZ2819325.1 tripartite tricarboxylate transporter TctB family protein [Modestobacter sp. VKM Ac-2977]
MSSSAAAEDHARTGTPGRAWSWAEAAFPVGLLALGVFTLVDASTIVAPSSVNTVGPQAFPYAVGVLLVLTSLALFVDLARGRGGAAEEGEDVDPTATTDWPTVLKLTGSFAALVVLVEPLGWPIAATVLFAGAAWSLGARPWWRPVLIGAVLAFTTQVLFTQLLDLYLPAGPLERVSFLG